MGSLIGEDGGSTLVCFVGESANDSSVSSSSADIIETRQNFPKMNPVILSAFCRLVLMDGQCV